MKFFLDRIVRSADAGGAGGGEGGTAPAGAGADGGAASSSAAAPSPAAGDAPAGGAQASSAVEIYKPEGLPDHMLGATNNETIDKLKKANDGYRERDAQNQIPEKAEAYADFGADLPDAIKPHLETLKADPLFERLAGKALEMKMPLPAYQSLVKEFLSVSGEMGLLEPPVDYEAEKKALVPDAAKHLTPAEQTAAREKRMNENFAFIDAAVAKGPQAGGLSKDAADFAKAMLGDMAKGHQFFEWARGLSGGGSQPFMGGGSPAAGDPKAALAARMELGKNIPGHKEFDQASYDQLNADYKKQYGA